MVELHAVYWKRGSKPSISPVNLGSQIYRNLVLNEWTYNHVSMAVRLLRASGEVWTEVTLLD
jgi:hypothetical protein